MTNVDPISQQQITRAARGIPYPSLLSLLPFVASSLLLLLATTAAAQATRPATQPASRPSHLTVHLRDATLKQAIDAISRMAPVELRLADDELPPGTVTLDADNQPFWIVVDQVCRKFRVAPSEAATDGVIILENDGGLFARRPRVFAGTTLVIADSLTHTQSVHTSGADREESFDLTLTALADPSTRVSAYEPQVALKRAVDDRGNSLIPPDAAPPKAEMPDDNDDGTSPWCMSLSAVLAHPGDKAGARIASLAGEFEMQCITRTEAWTLPNPLQARDAARNQHKGRCIISRVHKSSEKSYSVEVVIHRDNASETQWRLLRGALAQGLLRLHDANGKPLHRQDFNMDAHTRRINATLEFTREDPTGRVNLGPPATLVWDLPLEMARQKVGFEFKDLPMP